MSDSCDFGGGGDGGGGGDCGGGGGDAGGGDWGCGGGDSGGGDYSTGGGGNDNFSADGMWSTGRSSFADNSRKRPGTQRAQRQSRTTSAVCTFIAVFLFFAIIIMIIVSSKAH